MSGAVTNPVGRAGSEAVSGTGNGAPDLAARRAVEALRSGVPSRTVVAALGLGQPEVEDRFAGLLEAAGRAGESGGGLLLGGGFGAGKSHALEHLGALASREGFVVSRVVVSKETPLYDTAKLVRAAVETAVAPTADGWRFPGTAVGEALAGLDTDSPAYAMLLRLAASPAAGLDERFGLTLTLAGRLDSEALGYLREEVGEALRRFWSGEPLRSPDLRRWLREAGEPKPVLSAVPLRELARQRLSFLPRLFQAAGWAGWVLLVDEVELIGRYSLLQRGRSYAALAELLALPRVDRGLPFVPVLAVTDDFEAAVLTGKDDRTVVPGRMRGKERPDWDAMAADAVLGMGALTRDLVLLIPPDDDELDRSYAALRTLHGQAFGWVPPDVPGLERLQGTRMRQHVRAWINEWDLVRLDPTYTPATVAGTLATSYEEDPELEEPAGPTGGAPETGSAGLGQTSSPGTHPVRSPDGPPPPAPPLP